MKLESAYQQFSGDLRRFAGKLTGNPTDAEDIVQTAFLKLHQSNKSFTSEEHLKAWLYIVTRNDCLKWLKEQGRRLQGNGNLLALDSLAAEDPQALTEFYFAQSELTGWVAREIERLPDNQKQVIYLKDFGLKSFPEIAALLNITEENARQRYSRGIRAVRQKYNTLKFVAFICLLASARLLVWLMKK